MKINVVKKLVEDYDCQKLNQLIEELENGEPLSHPVEGDSEGEQLTHLLGAAWIHEQMLENETDVRTELRNFAARVRESIG